MNMADNLARVMLVHALGAAEQGAQWWRPSLAAFGEAIATAGYSASILTHPEASMHPSTYARRGVTFASVLVRDSSQLTAQALLSLRPLQPGLFEIVIEDLQDLDSGVRIRAAV
jgi:hypothetical protein